MPHSPPQDELRSTSIHSLLRHNSLLLNVSQLMVSSKSSTHQKVNAHPHHLTYPLVYSSANLPPQPHATTYCTTSSFPYPQLTGRDWLATTVKTLRWPPCCFSSGHQSFGKCTSRSLNMFMQGLRLTGRMHTPSLVFTLMLRQQKGMPLHLTNYALLSWLGKENATTSPPCTSFHTRPFAALMHL